MGAPLDRAISWVWRPRGGSDRLPGARVGVAWVGGSGCHSSGTELLRVSARDTAQQPWSQVRRTFGAVRATREVKSFLSKSTSFLPSAFLFLRFFFDVDHV